MNCSCNLAHRRCIQDQYLTTIRPTQIEIRLKIFVQWFMTSKIPDPATVVYNHKDMLETSEFTENGTGDGKFFFETLYFALYNRKQISWSLSVVVTQRAWQIKITLVPMKMLGKISCTSKKTTLFSEKKTVRPTIHRTSKWTLSRKRPILNWQTLRKARRSPMGIDIFPWGPKFVSTTTALIYEDIAQVTWVTEP